MLLVCVVGAEQAHVCRGGWPDGGGTDHRALAGSNMFCFSFVATGFSPKLSRFFSVQPGCHELLVPCSSKHQDFQFVLWHLFLIFFQTAIWKKEKIRKKKERKDRSREKAQS